MKKLIIKGMGARYFSDKIVKWYLENRRPLPWRETTDPYRIWLSEVILQQTRVRQGLPYYQRFVEMYPAVKDLAEAPELEVMRLWQGLGYYTRARNLHQCAKAIHGQHGGKFPEASEKLQHLPGIGDYTAAAIASFAFGERTAVVDGNVFRVLSRIFGITTPVNSPAGKKEFITLANKLVSKENPGLHNQAIMEFGALLCKPRNPACTECPFQQSCIAFQKQLITFLPVKLEKKKSRERYFYYLVIEKGDSLLMKIRDRKDIWQGLFDFVLIEKDKPMTPEKVITEKTHKKWFRNTRSLIISKPYKHVLTHQIIHCRFIQVKARPNYRPADNGLLFYPADEVARLPKPVLISRFLADQKAYS